MAEKFNDIAAVVATRDYAAARSWYSHVIGRDPDLEPMAGVAEWQIAATAWLQLIEDPDRAGKSALRIGVDDLEAQIAELADAGITVSEPVVIADLVKVVDVADPDGNEVSFVQDIAESSSYPQLATAPRTGTKLEHVSVRDSAHRGAAMHTPICDELNIEFPIFAFTHCRDVVVAVSKAGGFGVLGAVGYTPDQLEIELKWIDEHIGEHPYGVDIVIPNKYEGMDSTDLSPEVLKKQLNALVPEEHLEFARKILADHGVPIDHSDDDALQLLGWTEATATPQVEVALKHPKVTLIANALGTPPAEMIKHIHDEGRKVAALCGSPSQARKHADAGVDIIIAQGGEAGGHCGEIGSIVLWPQVVKEVAPVPVLAAGGIGSGQQIAAALALGAQGAWTGSQWVMVEESEHTAVQHAAYAKASSKDTVRSRSFTGKPARMLRNDWTEAWEDPNNPKPLGMPLQYMVSGMAVAATHKYPNESVDVAFNPIGQVVGQFTKVEKSSAVIERWVQEYLEATNTLNEINEAASI